MWLCQKQESLLNDALTLARDPAWREIRDAERLRLAVEASRRRILRRCLAWVAGLLLVTWAACVWFA